MLATPQDSFQRAKQWVKELQRQGNPNIVIALAGNKSDLNSKRKVEPEVSRPAARVPASALHDGCCRPLWCVPYAALCLRRL